MEQTQQTQQAQQAQPVQPQYQFPTEEVTLPSKGLIYPEGSPLRSGKITMKYMTAREEDILTNQNYIKNGTVIDKLLQSLIVDMTKVEDLLIGDKNAVLVAARILGYGQDYTFKYPHPDTGVEEELTIDLTQADEKLIEQELKGLKKINKNASPELTTRLKHVIKSVNGDPTQKTIREFIDNSFLARDSRAFRAHLDTVMPDINLTFDLTFDDGTVIEDVTIPIGIGFFWPDASI